MDDPVVAADEILGERPERELREERGLSGVFPADGESENWDDSAGPEPSKKSVGIGPFAKVPNRYFGSGMARKVGPSASLLYFALCEIANRDQDHSNTFRESVSFLRKETGLSSRTIRNVRIKLLENGLVECRRENGQSYTYTLLPQKLPRVPNAARLREKRKNRVRWPPEERNTSRDAPANSARGTADFAELGAAKFAGVTSKLCWRVRLTLLERAAYFADPSRFLPQGSREKVVMRRCLR